MFSKPGDKDIKELYQSIRVGMIQAVDTNKATVTIQWLDKSGVRLDVPIPMPFCEQGWGIYAMPRLYSLVLCSTRPYELPVILAYVPPNFMGEEKEGVDSRWYSFKQVSSFPIDFVSGEIILRSLIYKAKCKSCKTVSTLTEWAATLAYNNDTDKIRMENCPKCYQPAFVLENGKITEVNKIQLGTLLYMGTEGKLTIKINDGLSEDDGDTFDSGSLVQIEFDDNSNAIIKGIKDMTLKAVNKTEVIKENIDITSKDTKETTEHKLIESPDIELGDDSAITIVQAEKLIIALDRLVTELRAHTHLGNLGSPTGTTLQPYTDTTQDEVETVKTKAS